MAKLSSLSLEDVSRLRGRVEERLKGAGSLQQAAQDFIDVTYEELAEAAVLFRLFATIDFAALPERERNFVLDLGRERGCAAEIGDKTTVVTLLGTRGRITSWCDRHASANHLALPLTSASFIKTIPMVARLMSDMGTGIDWVDKQKTKIVLGSMGRMAQVLYVEDAAKTVTSDGFKVIPEQTFVARNGVRAVVGLGGAYLNRTIAVILLFTSELVPRERVERLMPLVHSFKVATMKLVMGGKLFPAA